MTLTDVDYQVIIVSLLHFEELTYVLPNPS